MEVVFIEFLSVVDDDFDFLFDIEVRIYIILIL